MENILKAPTNKQLLEKGLKEIGRKWGHYCRYNEEVTKELSQAGFIRDLRGIERGIRDPGRRRGYAVRTTLEADPNTNMVLVSESHFPVFNQRRLFKKGKLMKIRPKSGISLPRARKEKLLEVSDPSTVYVGWDYPGSHSSSREYRVSTLIDNIDGEIIYNELRKQGVELKVEPYPGKPENRGINLIVKGVPSLSSRKTYTVVLYHIAAYRDRSEMPEAIRTSYDLKETHATSTAPCQKPLWYNIKDSRGRLPLSILDPDDERGGDDMFFDYHVKIAFEAAREYLEKQGYKVFNPFMSSADIGRNTLQFRKNLLCVRKEVIQNKKRIRLPLTSLEEEISLWDLKRYNNYPYLKRKGLV